MSLDTIADTLTAALPILIVTAMPVLATTAGVGLWWLRYRSQPADDPYNVDDYRQPATVRVRTHHTDIDAPTQVIRRALPDAGAPIYAELSARHTAQQWLRELGEPHLTGATR
ncbi:hypothetical protein DKT68_08520 [Micromonospora acroterricola]|uniref:Uncharacterized protein n=1 Tax=Micromonospora acroterricola TaxID=2202421 RepID=A0A317DCV2_9ACTN|nr:hypothetical protein [Micromonospora acroterricola]PWR10593.1 hypothetical protein DKT68_08520 [Micromonospora acroterricola]